jgi:hypothetical protein
MRAAFLVAMILCSGQAAKADAWFQLVSYTCDPSNDRVLIELRAAYNENGQAMVSHKGENEWEPWSLLSL